VKSVIRSELLRRFSEWPETRGTPAPENSIRDAERQLGVELPADYKAFLGEFGAAVIGDTAILGLSKPEFLYDEPHLFTESTLRFREELPDRFDQMVVVSVDAGGNPVGFIPSDPVVFVFDFDFGGRHDLAPSFEVFLERILGKADGG